MLTPAAPCLIGCVRKTTLLSDRNDYPTSPARHAIRSFLFYSGLNARLGPWWWKPVAAAPYLTAVVDRRTRMFEGMPTRFDDAEFTALATAGTHRWNEYRETITAADKVVVEPNRCQVLGPDGRLVSAFDPHRGLPVYPSAWQYRSRRVAHRLDSALVFDGAAGRNLYHFIVDSLMALAWLEEEQGLLPAGLPLIVNRRIADHPFFRHLRSRSAWFDHLPWVILEPGEHAAVDRAYNVRPAPFREKLWHRVRGWYGTISSPKGRRLFVSRDSRRYGRTLGNEAQVAGLLRDHGFELFYAEHLSVLEQQAAFEEADWIVGLCGMALIQQIYMPVGQGSLLELMPRNRPQVEFTWQSWILQRQAYDVLVGSNLDSHVQYEVDLPLLRTKLEGMLSLAPGQRQFGNTLMTRESA